VERLALSGVEVVFSYRSDGDAAAEVERAVAEAGGQAHGHRADFSDPSAIEGLLSVVDERLPGFDILVNNAARSGTLSPIAQLSLEEWNADLAVGLTAAFRTIQHAAKTMRDRGRIVNISTLNTRRPGTGAAGYESAKAGVEQLTRVAALELAPRQITVNAVCPGATETDMLRGSSTPEAREQIAAATPLGRLGRPSDIADLVEFLTSPSAGWTTGEVIAAAGGLG
jgi:3-oxoacyl-[acyl-carrier protein] reductase